MKKYLFMAVAAIAALSSCSSDNDFEQSQTSKQNLVFTATMENIGGTRAEFDSEAKCAKWEEGDEIIIVGVDEEENDPTTALYVASGTSGDVTTFEPKNPGEEVSGVFFQAVFPASIIGEEGPESPAVINEEWKKDQFNMPMAAMSFSTNLKFKNLCGVLAITVKDDQLSQVKSIKVSSANRSVSGILFPDFDVDKEDGAMTNLKVALTTSDNPSKTLTVNYNNPVETDASGKVFYVAIPPSLKIHDDEKNEIFEYLPDPYKELKIEISDGNGTTKSMTTKKDVDIVIERNKIYNITFKDNSYPAGSRGTATATIGGVATDVNWVQLWENGPKFAEFNVGVTDGKAESYGGYYCWGSSYDESEGWIGEFYDVTDVILTGEHDTATNLWGNNWRMPTKEEFEALFENCKVKKEDLGEGKSGYRITGNGVYASNSIILPNAGDYENGELINPGWSFYWSSTQKSSYEIVGASYWSGNNGVVTNWHRNCGFSVRAVLNEN